ncbi:MAG: ABC transporter substrate-binding protein [Gammaproteobacteria bacterium]|nr:ABC transporter substrate-binding protein [Gammaproteobacteria bacterium]
MYDWEALKAMWAVGRISRRDFIKRSAALGISTALAGNIVSGAVRADEQPKKGGNLLIGVNGGGSSDSLDPADIVAAHMQVVSAQLYNTLVDIDADNDGRGKPTARPALAESWEAKPGAKGWVFKIRRGVTFHNGKTLTATDVVYSLNHHRTPDSRSAAKSMFASIVDIKATHPNEVVITLNSGNSDLPYVLADYHLAIGPAGTRFDDGIGTGAFILEDFTPGVRALTRSNAGYFRSDRGFVDSVETLVINDPAARLKALVSGAVHMINQVDPKALQSLARSKDVRIFETSGGSHYCFPMRCDQAPFNNKDLRLAMKYAIDRQAIVDKVLVGHGQIGNDQPIGPNDMFYASLPQRRFDPDKARYHFKKSRHTGPIMLSVSDGAFTGAIEAAQVFQESAKRAGIDLQIDRASADSYWSSIWMKRPFCASYWSGRNTADLMLSVVYKSDAVWNETYWRRPDFDRLLETARAELDVAMYYDLQQMVRDDGGEIIPMFNNTIDAVSSKIKGFVALPTYEMSGFRAAERVWLS